ncbi:MAG: BMP family ABC transporter substrate-binding protein [Rhodobacteraceae bacterium]|nr:BMP family ABC transporter substrate-binding protein [Paracoccaceae bacterium]
MRGIRLLAAATILLGAVVGPASSDDPLKVGFIYVGPTGDHGWNYQHDQGRMLVEETFGDAVDVSYAESVPEGADSERLMTQMALSGYDLIFTTSFGYMDPTINVASKFPDVVFEHSTGYKRADNVAIYNARFYEGRAVTGHIAGHVTKSNVVGYIATYPIPEVVRGINAAFLAARKVNPDVEFKIIWVYTWFNPPIEADAANALIEQGADVILQHVDSTAALLVAEEHGIWAFGQASDMSEFGPNSHITSIVNNWAPYYVERVRAVMDGTWQSTDTWEGLSTGMVEVSEISDKIPAEVKASALAVRDAIADGSLHPFTGPINRQDGTMWLAAGETASDGDLLGQNFYVEGIDEELPQ